MADDDKGHLLGGLKSNFLAGVLITAPLGLTIWLTYIFVSWVDDQVKPLIPPRYLPDNYLQYDVPGFGFIIALISLVVIGALTRGLLGRYFVNLSERIMRRIPVLSGIYSALKQILETVFSAQSAAFREVVMFEYPRKGIWAIGFITGTSQGEVQAVTAQETVNVFLPTTPNPTSGFLLMIPRDDVHILNMSVEEGIKLVISGGIVSPPVAGKKKKIASDNLNRT